MRFLNKSEYPMRLRSGSASCRLLKLQLVASWSDSLGGRSMRRVAAKAS
jgi:hypothetical protein